ncbi:MAG: hypothetical protein GY701_13115, partial [Sulfitobacter sp.]|nr:hypothetical protein [Sulfitobacter sp.]
KRRFIREAKAASALNHPNIVQIYDIGQQDGVDFIAMERVAGKLTRKMLAITGKRSFLDVRRPVSSPIDPLGGADQPEMG